MKKELGIFEKHLQIPMRIEKKKKRRANEGTLLEQIVTEFLAEQDRDLSLYAYDTKNNRLQKYGSVETAKDAIVKDPDRVDPQRAPDDVKAALDGEDDGEEKETEPTTGAPEEPSQDKQDRAARAADDLKADDEKRKKEREKEIKTGSKVPM